MAYDYDSGQRTPYPRGWQGTSNRFSMKKNQDGHISPVLDIETVAEDNDTAADQSNVYMDSGQ